MYFILRFRRIVIQLLRLQAYGGSLAAQIAATCNVTPLTLSQQSLQLPMLQQLLLLLRRRPRMFVRASLASFCISAGPSVSLPVCAGCLPYAQLATEERLRCRSLSRAGGAEAWWVSRSGVHDGYFHATPSRRSCPAQLCISSVRIISCNCFLTTYVRHCVYVCSYTETQMRPTCQVGLTV